MPATVNRYNCPLDATMSIIEGRWKCTLLCLLAQHGPVRFSELQRMIGQITSRILSKQLKELEADRMVYRSESDEGGRRVVYGLTERGKSIMPLLVQIRNWGLENRFTQVITSDEITDFSPGLP